MQGSMVGADEDYRGALGASALFWHAQRSGTFTDTLVAWRGNSGLSDVPVGGFYEGSSAQRACAGSMGAWADCLNLMCSDPWQYPLQPKQPVSLSAGCVSPGRQHHMKLRTWAAHLCSSNSHAICICKACNMI